MHFLDQAKIFIRSGAGGPGAVSFRREKYVQYGGPDGGNGGKGGNIVFEAVAGLNTLIDFRYAQHFKAQRGIQGMGRDRHGAYGEDLVIKLPVGTQVLADDEDRTLLLDLTEVGQRVVFLKGGDGGRGNASYKTSTNRAPTQHGPGWPYEEMYVWLRLKLLADAGLVGMPNAGKSTFINQVSNTKAKVGAYPFTTIRPQLGVVSHKSREFVLADIPGLIAGAADGVGIGDRFLGHIERCQILIHLIDATQDDPVLAWQTVCDELADYGAGLEDKPQIVALNKGDLLDPELMADIAAQLQAAGALDVIAISGATGQGVPEVLDRVLEALPAKKRAGVYAKHRNFGRRDMVADLNPAAFVPTTCPLLVVKVGSSLLVQPDGGVRREWLETLVADISARQQAGQRIIIVTSGAIALGARRMGFDKGGRASLADAQAAASVGQIILSGIWAELLGAHSLAAAQILVTLDDLEDRRRYLNIAATLDRLLGAGAVPVINENDSVATEEIRFGDNDRLAARVAQAAGAAGVILLSDVDGLYDRAPHLPGAALLPVVEKIDGRVRIMVAQGSSSGMGSGGMASKLDAADIATRAGIGLAICSGLRDHPLLALEQGGLSTFFAPREGGSARKSWLGGRLTVKGRIRVDDGAVRALIAGSSLLPAGALGVEGEFKRGDVIDISADDGIAIARGLSEYDAIDAARICGHRTAELEAILGTVPRSVLVHRDQLVLL